MFLVKYTGLPAETPPERKGGGFFGNWFKQEPAKPAKPAEPEEVQKPISKQAKEDQKELNKEKAIKVSTKFLTNDSIVGIVALGTPIPGDILEIKIPSSTAYVYSRGSFLACTSNVEITATVDLSLNKMFTDEGIVLGLAETGDTEGSIWLSAYGLFEEHVLQPEDGMLINNGIFLACKKEISDNASVALLGNSLTSTFLGGGGFAMRFENNTVNEEYTIYTQSRNIDSLIAYIDSRLQGNTTVVHNSSHSTSQSISQSSPSQPSQPAADEGNEDNGADEGGGVDGGGTRNKTKKSRGSKVKKCKRVQKTKNNLKAKDIQKND